MECAVSSPSSVDDLLKDTTLTQDRTENDFENISVCSFDTDLMNMDIDDLNGPVFSDFWDVADGSFHEEDSLIRDIQEDLFNGPIQIGGGRDDFDIQLLQEKTLKSMGVKEATFELTFKDHLFRYPKKMNEAKDLLKDAFKNIIEHAKKDLRPGDVMRAVIHNDGLDLPVFVLFRPMEDMNAEAMLNCLENVLNSNEDIPFDSSCRIDVDAIKYPRGRGVEESRCQPYPRKSKRNFRLSRLETSTTSVTG